MAQLPLLTYDEYTVLLSALSAQVQLDRETLEVASAPAIVDLAHERISIGRSLMTACLETREQTNRQHGHELEPLRVAWEQTETTTAAWR